MKKRAVISVNAAVVLFGMAGLFARWIDLPALGITFGRVFFSSAALGLFLLVSRQSVRLRCGKDLFLLICAGAVLALHWWAFLASIQLSTVAVGTITFSSFPLFVTFLEPLVFRQKVSGKNIVCAVVILIGVIITAADLSFENGMYRGFLAGMVSALAYAVLTLMNKAFTASYSSTVTAFYEQSSAAVFLLPLVIRARLHPSAADLGMLLFLGVVTTAIAHTLFISSLKELPAQFAGICSSMETVYGILFALILLGEVPTARQIAGAVIIIIAVIAAQTGTGETDRKKPGKQVLS